MYIHTNPHNHNIHQISPMHKFIKSHIQLWHNSSNACNVLDSSRCMRYRHQQQRSSPHDATKTSNPLNTKYSNLTTGYKYPKPLNTKYSNLTTGCKHPKTQYDYDAWTYKQRLDNAKSPHIYIQQPQCKRSPPFTLINSNNNCIIKYLRPHNQQVTIQIRVITALSSHNYHHNYQQTSTSTISYSLTIPCNFSQSN
jgi:hypothetical protein